MSDADRFPFREGTTAAEGAQPRPELKEGWDKMALTAVSGHHRFGQLQVHRISRQRLCSSNGPG